MIFQIGLTIITLYGIFVFLSGKLHLGHGTVLEGSIARLCGLTLIPAFYYPKLILICFGIIAGILKIPIKEDVILMVAAAAYILTMILLPPIVVRLGRHFYFKSELEEED
ncbi:MAG: hypothetical protein ACI9ZV_000855 [Candidatus Azotimanducaceae bacterium]|jgi:hypothetical protein